MTALALPRGAAPLILLLAMGCGREDLDLISAVKDGSDPCPSFETEADCRAQTSLGCSFQPNPTGCRSTDPECPPGACLRGDPFVRRDGRAFLLNGGPFEFKGVSTWEILQGKCFPGSPDDDAWLQSAFDDLVQSGTKVARIYAFQNAAGPNGKDFPLLDTTVRLARRAGIRLQLALDHEQGQTDCSEGPARDAGWYAGGYKNLDGAYTRSYWDYASDVAEKYKSEPTVLGYVLVQSMNAKGDIDAGAMTTFVNAVAPQIRRLAKDQLISLDLSWGTTSANAFQAIQELEEVDLVNIDDYERTTTPGAPEAGEVATLAKINKPVVIGEAAFELAGPDAVALQDRAMRASRRLKAWQDSGVISGALLWAYQPGWTWPFPGPAEGFDARSEDPLLQPGGVVANALR